MNYTTLASNETLTKTIAALKEHNINAEILETKEAALVRIKELIPHGASVMNGSSTTLEEIGFINYLKEGTHGWDNLHEKVLAETDKAKQSLLRRQGVVSDYYLGSAHAVTETGELLFASNTGSQLPHLAFTSPNIILVVGTQKITPTLTDGFKRIEEYVLGREDERLMKAYNAHTMYSKTLVLRRENPMMGRTVTVLFVAEPLGF